MNQPSDAALQMIERLKEKVSKAEAEVIVKKRLVNALAAEEGMPSVYSISDTDGTGNASGPTATSIKSDQFHGLPLATAVRSVLEMRQRAGLPERSGTADEIYADLIRGGYEFDTKDKDKAMNGLKISLGKNPVFRGVGQTGRFGLSEWYGGPRKRDPKQTEASSNDDTPSTDKSAGSTQEPEEPQ